MSFSRLHDFSLKHSVSGIEAYQASWPDFFSQPKVSGLRFWLQLTAIDNMNIRNDDATLLFHVLSSCFIAGILIGSEAFSLVAFLSSFAQGAYYDLPTNLENTLIAISVEPGAIGM